MCAPAASPPGKCESASGTSPGCHPGARWSCRAPAPAPAEMSFAHQHRYNGHAPLLVHDRGWVVLRDWLRSQHFLISDRLHTAPNTEGPEIARYMQARTFQGTAPALCPRSSRSTAPPSAAPAPGPPFPPVAASASIQGAVNRSGGEHWVAPWCERKGGDAHRVSRRNASCAGRR